MKEFVTEFSELQSSDEEYNPLPRMKRPSRKAGNAAKVATKLIADASQIEQQEARTVSPKSNQVKTVVRKVILDSRTSSYQLLATKELTSKTNAKSARTRHS